MDITEEIGFKIQYKIDIIKASWEVWYLHMNLCFAGLQLPGLSSCYMQCFIAEALWTYVIKP